MVHPCGGGVLMKKVQELRHRGVKCVTQSLPSTAQEPRLTLGPSDPGRSPLWCRRFPPGWASLHDVTSG